MTVNPPNKPMRKGERLSLFDSEGNQGFKNPPLSMLPIESQAGFEPRACQTCGPDLTRRLRPDASEGTSQL